MAKFQSTVDEFPQSLKTAFFSLEVLRRNPLDYRAIQGICGQKSVPE